MRWTFVRRGSGRSDRATRGPSASAEAARQAPLAAATHWRRLPPLRPTIIARPMLIGSPLRSLPPVSGTRPLLLLHPAPRALRTGTGDVIAGHVGIPVVARPDPHAGSAEIEPAPPAAATTTTTAPRLAPRLVQRTGPRPTLVSATDEYLGEPQPSTRPYASSAWLRMVESYRPPWIEHDTAVPLLPGMTETAKPDGGTVTSWSSTATIEPPRALAAARPDHAGTASRSAVSNDAPSPVSAQRRSPPVRRATLAESRRLGLGKPLPRQPARTAPTSSDATELPAASDATATAEAPVARDAADVPPLPSARSESPGAEPVRPQSITTPHPPPPSGPASSPSQAVAPPYRPAASAVPAPAALIHRRVASRPQTPDNPPPDAQPPRQIPPWDLADALRRLHGVDVSDVPVNRGPEVAAEARTLGARAFARDGEVFLPQSEGPLEGAHTRGLLAHELTHVAQQRVLGASLPAEDSEAGRALEAVANASERWALGRGAPPSPGAAGPSLRTGALWQATTSGHAQSRVQRQAGETDGATALSPPPSGRAQTGTPTAPQAVPQAAFPTAAPSQPSTTSAVAVAAPSASDASAVRAADGTGAVPVVPQVPQISELSDLSGLGARAPVEDAELRSARDRLVALAGKRPLDLDDPQEVRALADEVYRRIRSRLRLELLVDRERSGRLGDFR